MCTLALPPGICTQLDIDKHVLFVTNNATKSRKNYKKKFDKLEIQAEVVSNARLMHMDGDSTGDD